MKTRNLAGILLGLLCLTILGCGGDSGNSATPSPGNPVLSGTVTKGPISGATVTVFQIISSGTSNPRANVPRKGPELTHGTTRADGGYDLSVPLAATKGSLLVEVTGGSYTDEATGAPKDVSVQYPNGMRAVFGNISGAARRTGQITGTVTPFTELAYRQAAAGPLTDDNIRLANQKVEDSFHLPNIVTTKPADPNAAFPVGTSDDAKKYALALAGLSQFQKDFGAGQTLDALDDSLTTQLAGAGLSPQTAAQFDASKNNYAEGPKNLNPVLNTPATNPNAPFSIHTIPAETVTVSIGTSQTIQAHVDKADSTPVPDGTLVTFNTNFGTLSQVSAPTVAGIATVTLTSATVGTATVTATSGAASDLVAGISFADPNAPVSMTLTAGAAQGITNGTPVVLSANVVRAAGGPVPNGTTVSFAVTGGVGSLSGASTTSGGIATVNLTSAVAGASVTVTATAGAVTSNITVPFIAQPTQAIVKVRSIGSLPIGALIGGINATVSYTTGRGLSITAANAVVSGVGTGSTMLANANNNGQVVLGLLNVNGIPTGEFATLTFAIAPGNFPLTTDFGIAAGSNAIDTGTASIPGISAEIASVVIQ